jgi:hypothetical protein
MFVVFNRNMLPIAEAAYNIYTSNPLPAPCVENLLAAYRVSVFPLKLLVYTAFVNKNLFYNRYLDQLV